MAVDSGMQPDVVRAQLTKLERLLDDVDAQFAPLRYVHGLQGPLVWTSIPACAQFATAYRDHLAMLEAALTDTRTAIQTLLENLVLSARELARTDEGIQDRMRALADRLNTSPIEPVDVPGATSAAIVGRTMPDGPVVVPVVDAPARRAGSAQPC